MPDFVAARESRNFMSKSICHSYAVAFSVKKTSRFEAGTRKGRQRFYLYEFNAKHLCSVLRLKQVDRLRIDPSCERTPALPNLDKDLTGGLFDAFRIHESREKILI